MALVAQGKKEPGMTITQSSSQAFLFSAQHLDHDEQDEPVV